MPMDDPTSALMTVLDPEDEDQELLDDIDGLYPEKELSLREKRCAKEPWRCPPKPSVTRITEDAQHAKEDHAYRIRLNAAFRQWLAGERYGYFPGDEEFYVSGELVPAPIDALKNEHYDYCMWHARMDTHIEVQGRAAIGAEEKEAKEDFARLLIDEFGYEFAHAYGSTLKLALPECAGSTGMLAAFLAVDPGNETTGLRFQMFDPNAIFPVWQGQRGLAKVYVIQQATADEVIGNYGDNGGSVERKVRKLAKADSSDGTYNHRCEKELILYYDRDWTFVLWGGELMRSYQHGYGEVPFIIESSGVGMQGFMATPDPVATGTEADVLAMGGELWQLSSRQVDMARRNLPPLARRLASHAQAEALFSRYMSTFKRNTSPKGRPVVVGQEPMSVQDGEPELKPEEAGVSLTRKDDTLVPYPNVPEADLTTPILQVLAANTASGASSITTNGGNLGGAQAGGNAIDMLAQAGAERWSPITLMIEGFWSKVLRRAFELVRDYGESMGSDDEALLRVPRVHPGPGLFGDTDPHELSPDIFARTGCRVAVTLHKFNPMSLPPLVSAIGLAIQAGLMSKQVGIELIGAAQDIDDEIRRIKEDQLSSVPELMAAEQLEMGYKRALRAMAEGDEESARREILKTKYLADQLTVAMMARLSMVGQATMEAMSTTGMAQQSGAAQFGQAAMDPMLGPGGGGGMQPNAMPFMSPSPMGGTTGQSSPGRPSTAPTQPLAPQGGY
jgi:hypothetical protein